MQGDLTRPTETTFSNINANKGALGGGEGNFHLARIFFFSSLLVQEFFFQVKPCALIFF